MATAEVYQPPYSLSKNKRYEVIVKLGEGTFGEVRKARDRQTGRIVAVKRVRLPAKRGQSTLPKAIFREMQTLKQLSEHQHIVRLFDVYGDDTSVCLVMEYMDYDMSDVINYSEPYIPIAELKCYYQMMTRAVEHCHSLHIIHRDIKPSNFLVNRYGLVKLADFGLARIWDGSEVELSHQVCTRNYRPPELLFASRNYTPAVDIWGLGVIFAELMILRTLFAGQNDIDQMYKVFQIMGTPDPKTWPEVETLPDYSKVHFPSMEPVPLVAIAPHARDEDMKFICLLLKLNPSDRISAERALDHPYFAREPLPVDYNLLTHHKLFKNEYKKSIQGGRKLKINSVEDYIAMITNPESYLN